MTAQAQAQAAGNALCSAALVQALVDAAAPEADAPLVVVISPGARSTPMVLALEAQPRVTTHVVLDERAAAFVALGLAQASGRCVATLCTSGSAAAHALPAAMEAHHAGVPLLLLTADRPHETQGVGAAQTTAQQRLFAEHCRFYQHLPEPLAADTAGDVAYAPGSSGAQVLGAWQTAGVRALHAASGSFPGPAHLNLPFREPLGTEALPAAAFHAQAGRRAPQLATAGAMALDARAPGILDAFLQASGTGIIYCGARLPSGPVAAGFAEAVAALGARLQWPILAEGLSGVGPGSLLPSEALLQQVGAADSAEPCALAQPARVLHIGASPLTRAGQALLARARRRLLLAAPGTWSDPQHVADAVVQAPVLLGLQALMERAPARPKEAQRAALVAWQGAHAGLARSLRPAQAPQLAQASKAAPSAPARQAPPWFEGTALQAALHALPRGAQVVMGNSLAVRDLDNFCALPLGVAFWGRRGVSGIDGALAHLLGVGLAHATQVCVAMLGDLTALYDASSLRLCQASGALLVAVVFNNGGGQIFRQLPVAGNAQVLGPYFLTPQQQALAPLCAAYGVRHLQADSLATLTAAMREATAKDRPRGLVVVEASFDVEQAPQARRAYVQARSAQLQAR